MATPGDTDTPMNGDLEDDQTSLGVPEVKMESGATESTGESSTKGSYTWYIHGFNDLSEPKQYSDYFHAGGYYWRLLIFPYGLDSNGTSTPHISLFLDSGDERHYSPTWPRSAAFTLRIVNFRDPSFSIEKSAEHVFNQDEKDWGFKSFANRDKIVNEDNGFLKDGTLRIECDVYVKDAEVFNDPRRETGHIGLKNQGATCYMNSLLQTLFLLPYFRKAVYHMPTTEQDETNNSIPLALQSLFFKLQFSDTSVPTKELTRSFGWDTADAFMQHDIQELNRVLCEKLEEKMKSTPVEGTIQKLFEGTMVNYIECIEVNYRSSTKETFLDLQLDVKGCKNIYESLDKYVEEERLEGDNKYYAEGHGFTDAKKGVLFEKFPPVLELHLKRFEYDFVRDMNVKINSRYEFPDVLDLDIGNGKYLSPSADRSVRNRYLLHSVLVHSGGVHGGHYYAFIRPDLDEYAQWYKFDDERVTREDKESAIQGQYGTDEDATVPAGNLAQRLSRVSNAYMLVYVRESDKDMIKTNVSDEDIAEHIKHKYERELEERQRKQKEKEDARNYCTVKVATEEELRKQIGNRFYFDLADFEHVYFFKIPKDSPFSQVKEEIANTLGIPMANQRFWRWAKRENGTFRPSQLVSAEEEDMAMRDVRDHGRPNVAFGGSEFKVLLEQVPEEASRPRGVISSEILLFVKLYDHNNWLLRYCGMFYAKRNAKVLEYTDQLKRMAGFDKDTDLYLREEIRFHPHILCEYIDPSSTFNQCQLENGDIICVQARPTESDQGTFTVKDFFEYIKDRVQISIQDVSQKEHPFNIELSVRSSYDDVTRAIAEKCGVQNPDLIRLRQHNAQSNEPRPNPVPYRGFQQLIDIVHSTQHSANILYYEVLIAPLPELEKLKILPVHFFNYRLEEKLGKEYHLDRKKKVQDLLHIAAQDWNTDRQLRLLEVSRNRIYKVYKEDEKLEAVDTCHGYLRIEEMQAKEAEDDDGLLVFCYHAQRDAKGAVTKFFGEPFILKIGPSEDLVSVKRRVADKLMVDPGEMKRWKFFSMMNNKMTDLEDDSIVDDYFRVHGNRLTAWENYLGMEHEYKGNTTRADTPHLKSATEQSKPLRIK